MRLLRRWPGISREKEMNRPLNDKGMVQVGHRAPCDICGKDSFWFFGKCLCDCKKVKKASPAINEDGSDYAK